MPGTYSQLLFHIVFRTKQRERWITEDVAARLYPYIGGIIRAEGGTLLAINGIEDHVHFYLRWRTDAALSDLMRTTKARSSKWIHESFPALANFAWQEGYSAFTVSKSQEQAVRQYIDGQHDHHRAFDFRAELLKLLRAHDIDFEERYLAD